MISSINVLFVILLTLKANGNVCNMPPDRLNNAHLVSIPKKYIKNGKVLKGTFINYKCDPGYTRGAKGIHKVLCSLRSQRLVWYPKPQPNCVEIHCRNPDFITNGYHDIVSNKVGGKVVYHCVDGYEIIGVKQRVCLATGSWSGVAPRCREFKCPDVKLNPNSKVKETVPPVKVYKFRDKLTVECNKCMRLIGDPVMTCLKSKRWSLPPKCEEIQCPLMPEPEFANIVYKSHRTCGSTATLVCNKSAIHNPKLPTTALCTSLGSWDNQLGDCISQCKIVDPIEKGTYSGSTSFSQGEKLPLQNIKCDKYYSPNTTVNPICLKNTQWTVWPSCVFSACQVGIVSNATVIPGMGQYVESGNAYDESIICFSDMILDNPVMPICRNKKWDFWPNCIYDNESCEVPSNVEVEKSTSNCKMEGKRFRNNCSVTFVKGNEKHSKVCRGGEWKTPSSISNSSKPNVPLIIGMAVLTLVLVALSCLGPLLYRKTHKSQKDVKLEFERTEMIRKSN